MRARTILMGAWSRPQRESAAVAGCVPWMPEWNDLYLPGNLAVACWTRLPHQVRRGCAAPYQYLPRSPARELPAVTPLETLVRHLT